MAGEANPTTKLWEKKCIQEQKKSAFSQKTPVEGMCICGLECSHVGGTPTCTATAVCTTCGTAYGEVDPTNHNWENGVCTYGCNTVHEPHDWSGKDGICTVCGVSCDHQDSTHTTANNNDNVITESCSKCKVPLGTATITATNAIYDGTAQETATVAYGTGSASLSGITLTGGAPGTVTVIATKEGTSQYNPARSQPLVITIE